MSAARPTRRGRVLLTRPAEQASELADLLREAGVEPVIVPAIAIESASPGGLLDAAVTRLADARWVVVTSPNGARAVVAAAERAGVRPRVGRWAAVGRGTASVLVSGGAGDVWQPSEARAAALAGELPLEPGARVLLFRGSLADGDLPATLRERGALVVEIEAYRTVEAPASSRPLLRAVLAGAAPAAVVLASGSAVRGLLALLDGSDDGAAERAALLSIPAVCVGPVTAAAARAAGFAVVTIAPDPSSAAVAQAAVRLLGVEPG